MRPALLPTLFFLGLLFSAHAQEVTIESRSQLLSASVVDSIRSNTKMAFAILGVFEVSPKIRIILESEGNNARFEQPDKVFVPVEKGNEIDPSALVHEIAHVFFEQKFMERFIDSKKRRAEEEEIAIAVEGLQQDYREIRQLIDRLKSDGGLGEHNPGVCDESSKPFSELEQRWSRLVKRQGEVSLKKRDSESERPFRLLEPYSEQFADLATALVLDDPKNTLSVNPAKKVNNRDLTHEVSPVGWQVYEPHAMLHPAGSFIWKTFFKDRSLSIAEKRKLLLKISDSFVAEGLFQVGNAKNQPEISPELANIRLIRAVQTSASLPK